MRVSCFALLILTALTACKGPTAPDDAAGFAEPVPVEVVSGTLPEAYAGAGLSATLYTEGADGTGSFHDVATGTVSGDGTFALDLVDIVPGEYLTSARETFACPDLPTFAFTQVASLAVQPVSGEPETAMPVPEGTAEGEIPTSYYTYMYSDTPVEVDATCATSDTRTVQAAAAASNRLRLNLLAGWNLVHVTEGGGQLTLETPIFLAQIIWLLLAAS